MKKNFAIVGIVILTLVLLFSGCTEESSDDTENSGTSEPKTLTMNAQEYYDDLDYGMTQTSMKSDLKSLDDGDTLIFQDTISSITYDNTTDMTTINFDYEQESESGQGTQTSTVTLLFDGNLTTEYNEGDEVKATLTIKHVTLTLQGYSLDIDIYEEYWESEEYFKENYVTGNPYKPIPQSKITKV